MRSFLKNRKFGVDFKLQIHQYKCSKKVARNYSCHIDRASKRQILDEKKMVKDVHGNRKKYRHKKLKHKLKVKKENYNETCNQITYIKVEAVTTGKF